VAVSDEGGLAELLAAVFSTAPAKIDRSVTAPTARLRVLGVVHAGHVEINSVREEARGAGPGAPLKKTKITAVALGERAPSLRPIP